MSFTLKFKTDNAAFGDGAGAAEVARILRDVADKVANGRDYGSVQDINGNTVGDWDLELPEPEEDEDDEDEDDEDEDDGWEYHPL
jgi:hypothetical protein